MDVEGESKAVDEGHNDVTSLTHMCAQQLLKWQVPNPHPPRDLAQTHRYSEGSRHV
jgi:hypothetical protein